MWKVSSRLIAYFQSFEIFIHFEIYFMEEIFCYARNTKQSKFHMFFSPGER